MQNPVYPSALLRQGIGGVVVVEFLVGLDGRVVEARAIRSPHDELSKAAVAAILRSEYRPAIKDGKPTTALMQVPITFAP
jgi:protein TonB